MVKENECIIQEKPAPIRLIDRHGISDDDDGDDNITVVSDFSKRSATYFAVCF